MPYITIKQEDNNSSKNTDQIYPHPGVGWGLCPVTPSHTHGKQQTWAYSSIQAQSKWAYSGAHIIMYLLQFGVPHVNNKTVLDIRLCKPFYGCVNLVHPDQFNVCSNVVLGAKVQHLLCLLHSSDVASSNKPPSCKHRKQI